MSGYINITIRKRDGKTHALLRHTNSIKRLLHNSRLISETDKHLESFINEKQEFSTNLKAPIEYGLVVVDASRNIIAHAQSYTHIGVTFTDMISTGCQRVLIDKNGKAVKPRIPKPYGPLFLDQYLNWEDYVTLSEEEKSIIAGKGFLVSQEVERLKELWESGRAKTQYKNLDKNSFSKFIEIITEPGFNDSNTYPVFINLTPFQILPFSNDGKGFSELLEFLINKLNLSFNEKELDQWSLFTERD